MGICYSSYITNNRGKGQNNNYNFNGGDKSVDVKVKKSVSGEFSTFISKLSGGGAAAAAAEERALHQIPGRLFGNGSSRVSSLYTQQGKKGTNQDAMIVWENFCSRTDTIFCGVFDGHGPHGHMVARKVRDTLPLLLHTEWEATSSDDQVCPLENGDATGCTPMDIDEFLDNDSGESVEAEDTEKFPEMHQPLKRSILNAFKLMDKELDLNPVIDCFCSGSTAVTMIRQDQDLIVGNIGDSRAVLATRDKDNYLMAVQLTVDLKPNLPREAARIQKCKGRVFALQDEPEVARVWLPHSDSPGLAMARAFGDFCLKDFGLISVPDVYYHHINERDEFVLLATDGVWDVLSNKEAVDIVAAAPSRATAARALVDCATRSWRLKYPTSKTDDCAVVCLYLDHKSTSKNTTHTILTKNSAEETKTSSVASTKTSDADNTLASRTSSPEHLSEIVPVIETADEMIHPDKSLGQSKRSLAECLSTADDEEWSALEGISRVNSLLSIPRFLSINKRSTSWRNWL